MAGPVAAVFVYGTLMPGQQRWPALLPFASDWVASVANGVVWDTGHGYPAARFGVAGEALPGFVVRIEPRLLDQALAALDAIEGEGVLYRRVQVETSHGPAWAYEWLGEEGEVAGAVTRR